MFFRAFECVVAAAFVSLHRVQKSFRSPDASSIVSKIIWFFFEKKTDSEKNPESFC
ncbi:hypothetical protein LEP1GSC194_4270 [Leptospira alstonii serovar Sichuan str. 79601]|uniref:Uncharacterized protein n=1 Tax=Leptospira alstonii serovar Sichuan str. 79601 TaxID=1218565 RepID=M6D6A9_9LEPT|nr:hypothetical protein LEP1GSC194_4270 [Leptospira alstonii serovar Sichuan str. 79601]